MTRPTTPMTAFRTSTDCGLASNLYAFQVKLRDELTNVLEKQATPEAIDRYPTFRLVGPGALSVTFSDTADPKTPAAVFLFDGDGAIEWVAHDSTPEWRFKELEWYAAQLSLWSTPAKVLFHDTALGPSGAQRMRRRRVANPTPSHQPDTRPPRVTALEPGQYVLQFDQPEDKTMPGWWTEAVTVSFKTHEYNYDRLTPQWRKDEVAYYIDLLYDVYLEATEPRSPCEDEELRLSAIGKGEHVCPNKGLCSYRGSCYWASRSQHPYPPAKSASTLPRAAAAAPNRGVAASADGSTLPELLSAPPVERGGSLHAPPEADLAIIPSPNLDLCPSTSGGAGEGEQVHETHTMGSPLGTLGLGLRLAATTAPAERRRLAEGAFYAVLVSFDTFQVLLSSSSGSRTIARGHISPGGRAAVLVDTKDSLSVRGRILAAATTFVRAREGLHAEIGQALLISFPGYHGLARLRSPAPVIPAGKIPIEIPYNPLLNTLTVDCHPRIVPHRTPYNVFRVEVPGVPPWQQPTIDLTGDTAKSHSLAGTTEAYQRSELYAKALERVMGLGPYLPDGLADLETEGGRPSVAAETSAATQHEGSRNRERYHCLPRPLGRVKAWMRRRRQGRD